MGKQPHIDVKPDKIPKCCLEMARLDKGGENTTWGQRNSLGPDTTLDMGVDIPDGTPGQLGQV